MKDFTLRKRFLDCKRGTCSLFKGFVMLVVLMLMTTSSAMAEVIDGIRYMLDPVKKTATILPQINGYYSGYTFANQMGLTTQVPYTIEIVSNQASAKCREVNLKNQKIMLRKPRTEVTKENYEILQLLDLLKDFEVYVDDDMSDASKRISAYVKKLGIRKSDIDKYIGFYPDKIYKNIYETGVYDAFTRG